MTRPDDCGTVRELLDQRLEGGLDAERSEWLESHLEICFDCRAEAVEIDALRAETARLPRDIEPPRDLWPAIERRLETGARRRGPLAALLTGLRWPTAPVLAGAAAVLALAVAVWLWRVEPAPTTAPAGQTVDTEAIAGHQRARAELARFEDGVLLAHQDLLEAVESQTDRLAPETVEAIEENMRIIDQAIGQIRIALEDDPLNPRLNMLLAAQYQQEVQLLKRLSGV